MNRKLRSELVDKLFDAILLLKTREEGYSFFEDIGTVSEIKAFAQRLEVAKMLDRGIPIGKFMRKQEPAKLPSAG